MKTNSLFERQTGSWTILSGLAALGSMVVGFYAVNFNLDAFSDPTLILRQYSDNAGLAKWFALLDMLGYYLGLLPVLFYLYPILKVRSPWAALLTACGLLYVLVGAIGSAVLVAVWPNLMQAYSESVDPIHQTMLQTNFDTITWMVYGGLWNTLETLPAGIWWLGMGLVLVRPFKGLGYLSIVLGFSCLLDAVGNWLNWSLFAEIGLNIYLLLAIIWAFYAGGLIFKGKLPQESLN